VESGRLLSALLLLQAYGRLTGRELSRRLEVSMRTVHRDMEELRAAGVPVFALRGPQGGWQLDDGWRTQVPGLDEAELCALLMAQPWITGSTAFAAAAESAISKLIAALPPTMRERPAFIRQRLYIDPTGWRGTGENLAALPVAQDAIARDRKLSIRYRKENGEVVERVLDPLGLVAKGTTWYVFAGASRGFRTYRVSRMLANFDLAAAWKISTGRFRQEHPQYEVTLRVDVHAAEWIKSWQIARKVTASESGWAIMLVYFHQDEACFMVKGLGVHVEVVAPAVLRERVAAEVRTMAASYL